MSESDSLIGSKTPSQRPLHALLLCSRPVASGLGNCPDADLDSKGFGSSSLAECLERMGDVSGLAAPAACASEGAAEYYRSQPYPRQVVRPNSNQTSGRKRPNHHSIVDDLSETTWSQDNVNRQGYSLA